MPILPNGFFHRESDEAYHDGSTPLHRSYGVKRRVHPWREKAASTAAKVFALYVMWIYVMIVGTAFVMFWLYFPELWVKVVLTAAVAFAFLVRLTRTVRRRQRFCRRLRKVCRAHGYSMQREQGFFASLVWSSDRQDFHLETDHVIYYVRYLTVRKYRSSLYIEGEHLLRLLKRPINNKFTVIFERKPTNKYYPLDFQIPSEPTDKRVVKALIVNPVCEEMYYKRREGGYEVTGNRGEHFGFTVFTGSGFVDAVKRDGEQ